MTLEVLGLSAAIARRDMTGAVGALFAALAPKAHRMDGIEGHSALAVAGDHWGQETKKRSRILRSVLLAARLKSLWYIAHVAVCAPQERKNVCRMWTRLCCERQGLFRCGTLDTAYPTSHSASILVVGDHTR